MKPSTSSEFLFLIICVMGYTAAQTPPFSVCAAWRAVSPCSCRKRYIPGKCSCRPPPIFGSACFWVSSRSPKAGMDRHCRRAWQGADCHARTCGTWRRTSASLSEGVRPPAASSWCVPNTFPPAAPDAPSPRMDGVSPCASPQNTSYNEPPARKAAGGRLPPARPSPSDGCPVRTQNRPPEANRG